MPEGTRELQAGSTNYDAVIVGASLAGCTAAMLMAREGARVALVEKQPDPAAFKRICSHYIQASAVPTIERLGLMEPIMEAGAVRCRARTWTRWGVISAPPEQAGVAVNLRREVLDPIVRRAAAETPGVELMLGQAAVRLVRSGERFEGLVVRERDGAETELGSDIVVGADGRDSQMAKLAQVREKTLPHNRFAYGAYFRGEMPEGAPDGTIWLADPQFAAAFPTDQGEVFYAAMPTMDRLEEFKRNPEGALVSFVANMPDGPPIRNAELASDVFGKLDMTNRIRAVIAPGFALIGDAALATDPLFGVGCGWAFQSGEWFADALTPALRGAESTEAGLARYRARHAKQLRGHTFFIHDYATGRRMNAAERFLFSAAACDSKVAVPFDQFGNRKIGPARMFASVLPRAAVVNARHALRGSPAGTGTTAAPSRTVLR